MYMDWPMIKNKALVGCLMAKIVVDYYKAIEIACRGLILTLEPF